MKKIKILTSIVLTTFLATTAVLAWTDLGTVNDTDPLTATLWNATVGRINEIAIKVTDNSTPPVFSAELSANQNQTVATLLTAWTEHVDNTNSFTNGIFTVPRAGYYKIQYQGLFNHGGDNSFYGQIHLNVNDVIKSYSHSSRNASVNYTALTGINRIYYLNIGDTIKLKGYVSNASAFIYPGVHSDFTIEYIGE